MKALNAVENPCEVFHVMASICPPVVKVINPMCPPCSEAVRHRNILTKANKVLRVATGSPNFRYGAYIFSLVE
mgnify:CR=1 FL=1